MKRLLLIGLLLAPLMAAAETQSFDFKGIALGSDIAAIEGNSRFSCHISTSPLADNLCSLRHGERETIASAPVGIMLLSYYDGKLHTISISFNETHFSQVVAALKEKYGEGNHRTEEVQNRMGATFENRIFTWRRADATLEAKRFSSKIDTSSVRFYTDASIKEFSKRRGSSTKKQAKDL